MNKKRMAATFVPSTAIAGAAMALNAQYGIHAAMVEGGLALAVGAVARDTRSPMIWGAAGVLGYGAFMTYVGVDPVALYGWGAASVGGWVARMWFEHQTRHDGLETSMKKIRLETGQTRLDMARWRLMNSTAAVAEVDLGGHTPEETAVRTAFYSVYRQELPGVMVESVSETAWRAVVSLPPALERGKVCREWNKISGAMAGSGRWTLEDGPLANQLLVRYQEGDSLEGVLEYVSDGHGNVEDPVTLGRDEDGRETVLELLGRHTLILGTSGNGKSNLTNLLILKLVEAGAAVIGIDMKRGVELAPVEKLLVTLAKNDTQAREVFDWLEIELDRRSDVMTREGIRTWTEDLGPYVWIVTDELSELTQKKYKVEGLPDLPDLLESGLRVCRAFGIHFISATQAPSRRTFGNSTDARTNYKNRIATRCEEPGHAAFAFGPSWKSRGWDPNGKLMGPGEFLLSNEEHRKPMRMKAPYVSDRDLELEVARLTPHKVELEGSPWGSGGQVLSPKEKIRKFLRHRGEVTRSEIEEGTGLNKKQVLDGLRMLGSEIDKTEAVGQQPGVYWLATDLRVPIGEFFE